MAQTRTSTRPQLPRYHGENLEKNLVLADALTAIAAAKGIVDAYIIHRSA